MFLADTSSVWINGGNRPGPTVVERASCVLLNRLCQPKSAGPPKTPLCTLQACIVPGSMYRHYGSANWRHGLWCAAPHRRTATTFRLPITIYPGYAQEYGRPHKEPTNAGR